MTEINSIGLYCTGNGREIKKKNPKISQRLFSRPAARRGRSADGKGRPAARRGRSADGKGRPLRSSRPLAWSLGMITLHFLGDGVVGMPDMLHSFGCEATGWLCMPSFKPNHGL